MPSASLLHCVQFEAFTCDLVFASLVQGISMRREPGIDRYRASMFNLCAHCPVTAAAAMPMPRDDVQACSIMILCEPAQVSVCEPSCRNWTVTQPASQSLTSSFTKGGLFPFRNIGLWLEGICRPRATGFARSATPRIAAVGHRRARSPRRRDQHANDPGGVFAPSIPLGSGLV